MTPVKNRGTSYREAAKDAKGTMNNISQIISRIYGHRRFSLVASCIIAVAVLIAYSNTFTAAFQFDDEAHIRENPAVKAVTWENVKTLLRTTRPVTDLSLMFNYAVSGLDVAGWHVFNTGFHIANAVLVYFFVLATLLLPVFRGKYDQKARGMALFTALLFAVHPVQTESVTYIISRSELLATFFFLIAFLVFLRNRGSGGILFLAGMFCTALLSMGSKEWAVVLPAMLVLYDYLFLAEQKAVAVLGRWKTYAATALPWYLVFSRLDLFSAGGGAGGVGFGLASKAGGAAAAGAGIAGAAAGPVALTSWTYFLTSLNVIWTYIRLLFLPVGQNLDYDYPIARTIWAFPTLLSLFGHLAIIAGAFWLYRKKGLALPLFAVAWFYIGLSPVQSVVPIIDVIFEHRLYMPSIGVFLAFAVGTDGLFDLLKRKRDNRIEPISK